MKSGRYPTIAVFGAACWLWSHPVLAEEPKQESKAEAVEQARAKDASKGETKVRKQAGKLKGSVRVEESKGGEKTYTFEETDIEGRLRSPQLIYFLRRVRAEFSTRGLGHRSFLRELADTRRSSAIR